MVRPTIVCHRIRPTTSWWSAVQGVLSGAADSARSIGHTGVMEMWRQSGSIIIERSPEEIFDMVADVTRVGEWSPMCTACWWDEGDGPDVGAKFTGRNEQGERTWETRSEVVAADRGRQFAWVVVEPPTRARWGYHSWPWTEDRGH